MVVCTIGMLMGYEKGYFNWLRDSTTTTTSATTAGSTTQSKHHSNTNTISTNTNTKPNTNTNHTVELSSMNKNPIVNGTESVDST